MYSTSSKEYLGCIGIYINKTSYKGITFFLSPFEIKLQNLHIWM